MMGFDDWMANDYFGGMNNSAEFPDDHVSTLAEHEHVKDVERDGVVKTQ